MQIIAILVLLGGLAIGMYAQNKTDYSVGSAQTEQDAFAHEIFARTAKKYMAANPSATGVRSWAQIKSFSAPSFRNGNFGSFRLEIITPGTYVVCGQLRTLAAVNLAQRSTLDFTTIPLGDGKFVTAETPPVASTNSSKCI